jgi:hypothetical protein
MNTVVVPLKHRHVYNQQGVPVWWAWCWETLGPANNSQWGIPASQHRWRLEPSGWAMWFADPAHATMFALRWA